MYKLIIGRKTGGRTFQWALDFWSVPPSSVAKLKRETYLQLSTVKEVVFSEYSVASYWTWICVILPRNGNALWRQTRLSRPIRGNLLRAWQLSFLRISGHRQRAFPYHWSKSRIKRHSYATEIKTERKWLNFVVSKYSGTNHLELLINSFLSWSH